MKILRKSLRWIGIIAVLSMVLGAGWFFWVRPSSSLVAAWDSLTNPVKLSSTGLTASGTVETTVLSIGAEVPGKVLEVDFQEGDQVKAGSVLVRLDDGMLRTQRAIAAGNLLTAQLSLQQLSSSVVIAGLRKTIAQDKQSIIDARQIQDIQKYFTTNADAIQSAQANLYLARVNMNNAQTFYDKVKYNNFLDASARAAAYQRVYAAIQMYDHALALYNLLTGVPNPVQVDLRTAVLSMAEARLAEDQTLLEVLSGAPIPDTASGAGILKLQQARINIQIAQASLDQLDEQIGKMTITAPVDGVVMTRSVDPGNVVIPGSELLSMARLNGLNITVYIPAESYGKISLGQTANVVVDTYPGETFQAVVVRIADQPNFMPRTTHAASGASSTVYAIQLELKDAGDRLKSGMSADVFFNLK